MTLAPISAALLFVLALFCVGRTPSRAWIDVRDASVAVVIGYTLCLWSIIADLTPAQIVMDTTLLYVDPYAIWGLQDCALSAWLASIFIITRGPVTAIVGLLFAAQVGIHALAGQFGFDRQPYLDTLFVAQLIAIAGQGGRHSGERLLNRLARYRDGLVARRGVVLGKVAVAASGSGGEYARDVATDAFCWGDR